MYNYEQDELLVVFSPIQAENLFLIHKRNSFI